jgi:folate-dependent phosphoribosylglycinamide formyltransferase PurN
VDKLRIAIIGGTHPRHLYYHAAIANSGHTVVGALLEHRGNLIPEPPERIAPHDRALWKRHFYNRSLHESVAFGAPSLAIPNIKMVTREELNSDEAYHHIADLRPDLVLIFGCHLLKWFLPVPIINLHLGLSPRYRGSATLFWPFYFLEPNWAGCTFHQIVREPDAGMILHQCRPELKSGDTIHQVATRAVITATVDMLKLLDNFEHWAYKEQKATGKNFLSSDFQTQHLRNIYDLWNDQIVDSYLNGEIKPPEPRLYRGKIECNGCGAPR